MSEDKTDRRIIRDYDEQGKESFTVYEGTECVGTFLEDEVMERYADKDGELAIEEGLDDRPEPKKDGRIVDYKDLRPVPEGVEIREAQTMSEATAWGKAAGRTIWARIEGERKIWKIDLSPGGNGSYVAHRARRDGAHEAQALVKQIIKNVAKKTGHDWDEMDREEKDLDELQGLIGDLVDLVHESPRIEVLDEPVVFHEVIEAFNGITGESYFGMNMKTELFQMPRFFVESLTSFAARCKAARIRTPKGAE